MNQSILKISIFGLLATVFANCGTPKTEGDHTGKNRITFPTTRFTILPLSDTTVFAPQGTRLFIEKESFQFVDGSPVTDSVKLEINEFYKKSDILLADLSTKSDDKLLETGGMLKIMATSGGENIQLKSDKRIVVHFPKQANVYKKMNLFYADGKLSDTVTNWKVDTVNLVKQTLKLASYGWECPAFNDCTSYDFKPRNYVDTGYYWNPIDFYVSAYNFTEQTKKEVEKNYNRTSSEGLESSFNGYGIECEMVISKEGKIKGARVNSNVSKATKDDVLNFLKNIPVLEPGKNKYGTIIERRGFLFIKGGNILPLYKTREEYVKSFNSKYSKYEKKPIKNIDDAELEYYIFSVGKLGWINCDRFYQIENKVDYLVKTPEKDAKIKMVFKDINGVLMGKAVEDKSVFLNVPVGKQATIVAFKNVNGQLQAAFQEVTISASPLEALAFKEITLEELKNKLEKLN